tara:strand:+ start:6400 stop:6540 length:141 start_codon:yes stop_codon:yes gene_type:complete
MIKDILDALQMIENSDSEIIQIAKGKYKYPYTWKSLKKAIKTIKNK